MFAPTLGFIYHFFSTKNRLHVYLCNFVLLYFLFGPSFFKKFDSSFCGIVSYYIFMAHLNISKWFGKVYALGLLYL